MNHREGTHHRSHLVALQPSDEVPLQRQVRQLLLLGQRLLQPALAEGSLAAGRALVQGATSGDLTQVGEAGRAVAGGVVGGVGSVVGGVAHAGQDVVGGVRAGVRSTSTTLFD